MQSPGGVAQQYIHEPDAIETSFGFDGEDPTNTADGGSNSSLSNRFKPYSSYQLTEEAIDLIIDAQLNSEVPPSILQRTVEMMAPPEQESHAGLLIGSMLAAKAMTVGALRFGALLLARIGVWALNAARTVIFGIGRLAFQFLVRPLITGLGGFLMSPPGMVVGGLLAGAGLGYLLYKTLAKGSDPNSAMRDVAEPEGMAAFGVSRRSRGLYNEDWEKASATIYSQAGEIVPQTEYSAESMRTPSSVARRTLPPPGKKGKLALKSLVRAMDEAGITNVNERAMFLGQMAHESGNFRYSEEQWGPTPVQRRYEGRRDLGNVQPGDGYRFRGRGYIQLTGRDNYRRAGKYLGIDLENNPDWASDSDIAAKIAIWYWTVERPKIPAAARAGNIKAVTKMINGGYNGLEDRENKYYSYLDGIQKRNEYAYTSPGADTSLIAQAPEVQPAVVRDKPEPAPIQVASVQAPSGIRNSGRTKEPSYINLGNRVVAL